MTLMRKRDCPQSAIDNTTNEPVPKAVAQRMGLLGMVHLIYFLARFDIIVSEPIANLLALTHALKIIIT